MAERSPVAIKDGAYEAIVRADSIGPNGSRITTIEATSPRFILAEQNTHGIIARSSASSRARPSARVLHSAIKDYATPLYMGQNKPGMSAENELSAENQERVLDIFQLNREIAFLSTVALNGGLEKLLESIPPNTSDNVRVRAELEEYITTLEAKYESIGIVIPALTGGEALHKQNSNRIFEVHTFHTILCTATEFDNFFALRIDDPAQPEFRHIAEMMREARNLSVPTELGYGEWHAPFITEDDIRQVRERYPDGNVQELIAKIAVAKCARVSYKRHDGTSDVSEDIGKANELQAMGHMSPFGHVARPMRPEETDLRKYWSRFNGWVPLRKELPNEGRYDLIKLDIARLKKQGGKQ